MYPELGRGEVREGLEERRRDGRVAGGGGGGQGAHRGVERVLDAHARGCRSGGAADGSPAAAAAV